MVEKEISFDGFPLPISYSIIFSHNTGNGVLLLFCFFKQEIGKNIQKSYGQELVKIV